MISELLYDLALVAELLVRLCEFALQVFYNFRLLLHDAQELCVDLPCLIRLRELCSVRAGSLELTDDRLLHTRHRRH